ncbi:MAG: cytochrome c oxidase assembly protein [Actinomycetota bacterium]
MNGRRLTVAVLVGVLLAMVGLTAAAVPLYRLYCAATGAGGTPRVAAAAPGGEGREITVRFDANVAKGLPWRFEPEQREMTVRLGETALATFRATNTANHAVTGQAVFNVTPDKAGRYFDKIQCFCFSEQHLDAGQTAEMPVSFFVDPKLATDPHTDEVRTITLSYTFFPRDDRQGQP